MSPGRRQRAPARTLVLLLAYQAAWFACVIGAANDMADAGIAAVAAVIVVHLAWSSDRRADAILIGAAIALGALLDGWLSRTGLVVYAGAGPSADWPPVWILAMWALFAIVLREPLRWMHGRPLLAASFGAVGGPFAYAAAARLDACRFGDGAQPVLALAIGWAVAMPLLLALARRVQRPAEPLREANA
ncbi:MAG: DUF2878 domain-containing protein [Burkholderiaceae bacterium]